MQRLAADLEPDVEGRLEATLRGAHRTDRRQQLRASFGFAILFLTVVLVAVPLIDAIRRAPQVGASPSPTPAASLSGTFATTLVSTEPAVVSNRMAGDWTMQFGSNGLLTMGPPPGFTGNYTGFSFDIDGSQFRNDLFGEDVCSTLLPGTYRWSVTEDRLTFSVLDDSCSGRVALLTSAAWNAVVAE